MYIETHSHLTDEQFKDDLESVIEKCKEANIGKIIVCGYTKESNKAAIELAYKYDFCYASVGLHPENVEELEDDTFEIIEEQLKLDKVVAVGECGLDYYWIQETKEIQKEIFKKQIELSIKYDKPIIVHSREAVQDTYDLLKGATKPIKGVVHGYSGSVEMAREFVKLGMYIGIGGVATFKNAKNVKEVVKAISLDNIVLETDCPYLTPVPFRGKRNDPSYIPYIADEISNLKEISKDIIEEVTTKNAIKLFKI